MSWWLKQQLSAYAATDHERMLEPIRRRVVRTWHRSSPLRLLATGIELMPESAGPDAELAVLGEDGLPVAWRIFAKGWNPSRNGPALFDELAAELVMRDYREHGARIQVDRNHRSLKEDSAAYDDRAYGWHLLELREDGSLWAVDATWTDDGAELLKKKQMRYYSPAFSADDCGDHGDEPDRIVSIFNGALVGTPATDRPMALMAASRRKGHTMDPTKVLAAWRAMSATDRERMLQIWRLTPSQAELPSAKLAELLKWQESPEDVDPKVLAKMVQAMGGDASQGIGGLMRQLRTFMEMAMKALMGETPAPEAVPTEGEPEAMATDKPEEQMLMAASRKHGEELRKLRAAQEADRKLLAEVRKEREAEQWALRMQLIARAAEHQPHLRAMFYEDPTVKPEELKPKGSFATMSLDELRGWSSGPKVNTGVFAPGPRPAGGWSGVATQPGRFDVSEDEEKKLKEHARRNGRDPAEAWQRYLDHRLLVITNASGQLQRTLSRRYSSDYRHPDARNWNVVLSRAGGGKYGFSSSDLEAYRTWSSQTPIEGHSAVSIAAMRTFDERYNMLSAAPRVQWVGVVGEEMPAGTIGDKTYVLDFEELFWEVKTAQGPGLQTPQTWSLDVRMQRYTVGATANLEMLETPGSFDYLTSTWLAKADKAARGKDRKMAALAIAVLKAPGAWLFERFLDGELQRLTDKRMFAVDHPIHPFDPNVKDINGNTTWSNYETAATPWGPAALKAQKTKFNLVPNYAGEFLQMHATHVLAPTCLYETVNDDITVKDRILAIANVGGTPVEGQETNANIGSGMTPFEIPEMEGADETADWMIFSEERKAAGYVPFLVCVGTERVKVYGPGSDFALDTDHIKEVREVDLRAVPIRPEAVRWIKGS